MQHLPYPGQIVQCNFQGFNPPEMTKIRPVLVLSPRPERNAKKTCVIVALSTTAPPTIESYHLQITLQGALPKHFSRTCWVKGDMVYTVALHRLTAYWTHKDESNRRVYWNSRISQEELIAARQCAACAIGIYY